MRTFSMALARSYKEKEMTLFRSVAWIPVRQSAPNAGDEVLTPIGRAKFDGQLYWSVEDRPRQLGVTHWQSISPSQTEPPK